MSGKSRDEIIGQNLQHVPINKLLGAEIVDADPGRGWIRARYIGRDEFLNRQDIVQGGILTAMLDNAMARALRLFLEDDIAIMSLEIKTSFVAPAPPGELFCEGTVVSRGKSSAFVEGRLFAPDGTLCATASSTCRLIPLNIAKGRAREAGKAES